MLGQNFHKAEWAQNLLGKGQFGLLVGTLRITVELRLAITLRGLLCDGRTAGPCLVHLGGPGLRASEAFYTFLGLLPWERGAGRLILALW